MKRKICFPGLLCLYFLANAQEKPAMPPLKIGDKIPDIVISNIINSRIKSAHLSDYKGKLVILEFWSTWCSACISGFPELDSLQRLYPANMQVFLVNPKREHDTPKEVKMVIDRINDWSPLRLKLPIVFQDTALTQYFHFRTIPNCVWIGPDGKIIAITGKEQVTAQNIEKVVLGEKLTLPVKDDYTNRSINH